MSSGMRSSTWDDKLGSMVSSDGLFVVDLDQRIVHWSETAEKVLGFSADEVKGRPCYEVLGGNQPASHPHCRQNCQVVANARRGRPTRDFDVRSLSEDRDAWFNVSILLMPDNGSDLGCIVHLVRDVTDRRAVDALGAAAFREEQARRKDADEQEHIAPLSRREQQVVQLLASGYQVDAIAEHLRLSPITIRNHITRAMSKLGARSRLEAVVLAARHGFL